MLSQYDSIYSILYFTYIALFLIIMFLMRSIILFMAFLYSGLLLSQATESETQAIEMTQKAIELMDNGKINESLKLLNEALKLDPENNDIKYEKAYAYYLDKNYKSAIKELETLRRKPDASPAVYQLLGNSYDLNKKSKKAIEIYDIGLAQFPKSGSLHLERGNMELIQKNYSEALKYYEKGIEVDPFFPSNYYWASKIYLSGDNEVWGMLYGEMFLNIERGTRRTQEISKLLYDTYVSEITFTNDTSIKVSFSSNKLYITNTNPDDIIEQIASFGLLCYEPYLSLACLNQKVINIKSLHEIRTNFLSLFNQKNQQPNFKNILFDFQDSLISKNNFEAYNYWLLNAGNPSEFQTWKDANKEKWDLFSNWFKENGIPLTETNYFHKKKMKYSKIEESK